MDEVLADRQIRLLTTSNFISAFGRGLFMSIEVIYFSVEVGIKPGLVAIALGAAALTGIVLGVPLGILTDRIGARNMTTIGYILEGLAIASLVFVSSFEQLLIANIIIGIAGTGGHNAQGALVAHLAEGETRVKIRATQRAVTNLSLALGTVFAGIALAVSDLNFYKAMLLANAVTFVGAGLVTRSIAVLGKTVEHREKLNFMAVKDLPYLGATLLNGIVGMHFVLQSVALPLWITTHTEAPKWWVAVLFILNTLGVALFQVALSSGTGALSVSVRKFRIGSWFLLLACLLYGITEGMPPWMAAALLALGMAAHTAGELLSAAGSWSIGFDLADQKHMGQYQSVFSIGWGLSGSYGPFLVVALILGNGPYGWLVMGAIFVVAAYLMEALAKAQIRKRPELT